MNADLLMSTDQHGIPDADPAPASQDFSAYQRQTALRLGEAMMGILTQKHGAATARDFATTITAPTTPGTPERAKQDDAWAALQRRLLAASGAGE